MKLVDLTRRIEPGMPVYPGDPPVDFTAHATQESDGFRVTRVELGTHTGTHLDAPAHFLAHGGSVESLPLEKLVGTASVRPHPGTDGGEYSFEPGQRVLIASGWSEQWGSADYFESFPGLPEELVHALETAPAALIGLETPSLHPDHAVDAEYHRRLLGAGVVIVENLVGLRGLPGEVELTVLPLPLSGLDGAPCRVIVSLPG